MQETIPKRGRKLEHNKNFDSNFEIETNNCTPFENESETKNSPIFNKDLILGKLLKEIRQTGNSLLFAMLTHIKGYELDDNQFVVICDQVINYQDILQQNNKEIIEIALQKIDSNLTFNVKLEEDKTKEIIANNVKVLKETFGKIVRFIE